MWHKGPIHSTRACRMDVPCLSGLGPGWATLGGYSREYFVFSLLFRCLRRVLKRGTIFEAT